MYKTLCGSADVSVDSCSSHMVFHWPLAVPAPSLAFDLLCVTQLPCSCCYSFVYVYWVCVCVCGQWFCLKLGIIVFQILCEYHALVNINMLSSTRCSPCTSAQLHGQVVWGHEWVVVKIRLTWSWRHLAIRRGRDPAWTAPAPAHLKDIMMSQSLAALFVTGRSTVQVWVPHELNKIHPLPKSKNQQKDYNK